MRLRLIVILAGLIFIPGCQESPASLEPSLLLRLAVTTSTRDSGLLDVLVPRFEQQHNVRVDVLAVGTGAALKLGESGDADVVFVHDREAEDAFMDAKHGIRREDVMYNTFEILGPEEDPAAVKGFQPTEALRKISQSNSRFVSRGDHSGTHKREQRLWTEAGGRPVWDAYIESGQGMGATLTMADEMQAYVLADRGTYLKLRDKVSLVPLVTQAPELKNAYGVIVVNPDKSDRINRGLANAFVDYLISPEAQRRIGEYRINGEPLFVPLRLPMKTE